MADAQLGTGSDGGSGDGGDGGSRGYRRDKEGRMEEEEGQMEEEEGQRRRTDGGRWKTEEVDRWRKRKDGGGKDECHGFGRRRRVLLIREVGGSQPDLHREG